MLDEKEYARIWDLFTMCASELTGYAMDHGRSPSHDLFEQMFRPMLDEYERLTGMRAIQPNVILHHRLANYGPPCPQCGRPFRTPRAAKCMECGCGRSAVQ